MTTEGEINVVNSIQRKLQPVSHSGFDLAAAAARGRKGGRKRVIDAEKLACARSIVARGLSVREAATRLKVGKTALYEALRIGNAEISSP